MPWVGRKEGPVQGGDPAQNPISWSRARTNEQMGWKHRGEGGGFWSRACDLLSPLVGLRSFVSPLTAGTLGPWEDGSGLVQLRKALLSTYCTQGSVLGPLQRDARMRQPMGASAGCL